MKFCGTAELFTIPGPLMVMFSVVVIVKALAMGVKMRLATSNLSDTEISVVFELSKVAVSVGPFGSVAGVQLAAIFQSPLVGFRFQMALPAIVFGQGRAMTNGATRAEITGRAFIGSRSTRIFRNVNDIQSLAQRRYGQVQGRVPRKGLRTEFANYR